MSNKNILTFMEYLALHICRTEANLSPSSILMTVSGFHRKQSSLSHLLFGLSSLSGDGDFHQYLLHGCKLSSLFPRCVPSDSHSLAIFIPVVKNCRIFFVGQLEDFRKKYMKWYLVVPPIAPKCYSIPLAQSKCYAWPKDVFREHHTFPKPRGMRRVFGFRVMCQISDLIQRLIALQGPLGAI